MYRMHSLSIVSACVASPPRLPTLIKRKSSAHQTRKTYLKFDEARIASYWRQFEYRNEVGFSFFRLNLGSTEYCLVGNHIETVKVQNKSFGDRSLETLQTVDLGYANA